MKSLSASESCTSYFLFSVSLYFQNVFHIPSSSLVKKHSGIPENLLEKAKRAKALIYDIRTKDTSTRQRLPVVPQGIEKDAFIQALEELAQQLGKANVEVNDKPQVDGWYMER